MDPLGVKTNLSAIQNELNSKTCLTELTKLKNWLSCVYLTTENCLILRLWRTFFIFNFAYESKNKTKIFKWVENRCYTFETSCHCKSSFIYFWHTRFFIMKVSYKGVILLLLKLYNFTLLEGHCLALEVPGNILMSDSSWFMFLETSKTSAFY